MDHIQIVHFADLGEAESKLSVWATPSQSLTFRSFNRARDITSASATAVVQMRKKISRAPESSVTKR